jgi:hypothetical protein
MCGVKIVIVAIALLTLQTGVAWTGAESPSETGAGKKDPIRFRIELKREATNRGAPDESSKTQVKIDAFLDGVVSLLRLEMPFPGVKWS